MEGFVLTARIREDFLENMVLELGLEGRLEFQ